MCVVEKGELSERRFEGSRSQISQAISRNKHIKVSKRLNNTKKNKAQHRLAQTHALLSAPCPIVPNPAPQARGSSFFHPRPTPNSPLALARPCHRPAKGSYEQTATEIVKGLRLHTELSHNYNMARTKPSECHYGSNPSHNSLFTLARRHPSHTTSPLHHRHHSTRIIFTRRSRYAYTAIGISVP